MKHIVEDKEGDVCRWCHLQNVKSLQSTNCIKKRQNHDHSQIRMREVQGAICIASIVQLVIGYTGVGIKDYNIMTTVMMTVAMTSVL